MSDMISVKLTEATPAQLREFATNSLGLEIGANAKPDAMLAHIKKAWHKPEISVSAPAPVVPKESKATAKAAPTAEKTKAADDGTDPMEQMWVTVHITSNEEPGGKDAVPLAVNGKNLWVLRDKDSEIRYPYFAVLQTAIRTVYDQEDTPNAPIVARYVPQYPYRLVRGPYPESERSIHTKAA